MQHIKKKLSEGFDRLALSRLGRRLAYLGIVVVGMGVGLACGVLPDASFTPGWQPATTKVGAGGTDILIHGKMIGSVKGNVRLPPKIWVSLTKKADYYVIQRPVSGHGLLVTPLVITAIGSLVLAAVCAVVLARYRRRHEAYTAPDGSSASPIQLAENFQRSRSEQARYRAERWERWRSALRAVLGNRQLPKPPSAGFLWRAERAERSLSPPGP